MNLHEYQAKQLLRETGGIRSGSDGSRLMR